MLTELSIKNFAIIDDLNIRFSDGLTILSGETGAGKSIIINAVNLILGTRASSALIRTGADTARLEAVFTIFRESEAAKIMAENGIDYEKGLIIRRIIAKNNRHKIYINDKPGTNSLLKSITGNLASISGQHAHQKLLDEAVHLHILDRFGELEPLIKDYKKCFDGILPLIKRLDELKYIEARQKEHTELLNFQKNEIEKAGIKPKEDEKLEKELLILKNSEALYKSVFECIHELYDGDNAVIEKLSNVRKILEKAGNIDSALFSFAKGIEESIFQTEEIVDDLRDYKDKISMDQRRMEEIEERLDFLFRLKRKYGDSLDNVLKHLEEIKKQLGTIENISDNIKILEDKLDKKHKTLSKKALGLSKRRKKIARILAKAVEKELADLKMAGTSFAVKTEPAVSPSDNPYLMISGVPMTETGIDRAAFMIAPNPGEDLKPLSAIVSGGELSRVVLALKAILAKTDSVETIIFDEVDAGIGGAVAETVGRKIASLAKYHQVICITHLPQIAKFADHHFRISKKAVKGRTITRIKPLNEKERIEEIARMLGGEKLTVATMEHAKEMLGK